MKIGVISDIHGNIDALKQVVIVAQNKGVEMFLVLGDIVGYYYNPGEVLELLNKWEYEFIRGNHEEILASIIQGTADKTEILRKYGSAHYLAADQLSENEITFLTEAPDKKTINFDEITIMICHGSPWDHNFYVYPDTPVEILNKCNMNGVDYVFVGHSHYAFEHHSPKTILVNVGSVGQSRERGGEAQWVIFDTQSCCIDFMSTKYDVDPLLKTIAKIDPDNNYLKDILTRN